MSRISFLVWVLAEGMAKMISSIPYCSTASRMQSLPPTMGMPRMSFPWQPGWSSMMHLAHRFRYWLLSSSFRIMLQAAPAPIIMVLTFCLRSTMLARLLLMMRRIR